MLDYQLEHRCVGERSDVVECQTLAWEGRVWVACCEAIADAELSGMYGP